MKHEIPALDLKKLAGGSDSRVADMLAELEGGSLSSGEASSVGSLWTQQFAASGKTCQPSPP